MGRFEARDQGRFLAETIDSLALSAEQPGSIRVIARAATSIAAFIGRALKGPVNEPVPVRSFADYTRVFGGLWQPSTMSYAVEQFFENGGRCAIIVRVVNGARPPTLTLPTASGKLILRGVGAGSREFLRASVDYDAIEPKETDRFNLVVQRVRTAGSEQIEDQEIFRRLSITPGSDRFIADMLLESRLARVQGSVPTERPARTPPAASGAVIGYTPSNPDGDDGGPITDYDIIGSAQLGTGIFVFAKRCDRPRHFVRIHLREQIHFHDHDIAIQRRGDLLIQHQHQPSRIGPDFVFRNIHIMNDGDALQIGGHLFERVPFGCLGGKSDRIFPGVAVPHAMLTRGIDDPDVSERRGSGYERRKREQQGNGSIRFVRRQECEKRQSTE